MASNDLPTDEVDGRSNFASKLAIVAILIVAGVAAWWALRPTSTPNLSAYSSASASRPAPFDPRTGMVVAVIRTPATRPGEKEKTEELVYGGTERTQTGPDTFAVVQKLIGDNGRVVKNTQYDVKIVPATLPSDWPSANATPREIDLLEGLDLKTATVLGTWTRGSDGSVRSDLERLTRFDLGYRPPGEYDLRFTFTRVAGNDGLDTILFAGGRQFYWTFAGWDNTVSGFGTVLGNTAEANVTTTKRPAWLKNGTPYTTVIQVRRDGVRVSLDGQVVAEHKTDYRDLNLILRNLYRPDSIGFSTWESSYAIKDVRLTEITGEGQRAVRSRSTTTYSTPTMLAAAAIDFSVAGGEPGLYFLGHDGIARGTTTSGTWSLAGDQIVFRWGNFTDSCKLAPDGKSFSGRNQIGDAIRGTLRAGRF